MKSLGDILVNRSIVTTEQLEQLVAEQRRHKGSNLDELAVSMGMVEDSVLYKALAEEMGYPFAEEIRPQDLESDVVELAPMAFCREHKILPIRRRDDRIIVATSRPLDFNALDDLKLLLRQEVDTIVTTQAALSRAIEQWFASQKDMTERVIASLDEERERYATDDASTPDDLLDQGQAPVVKLVNSFLYQAVKARASDIHIEPYENKLRVRYRIDGVLFDAPTPPKELQSLIISRIKIQAEMDISESRLPQDGSMSIQIGRQRLDIRVSTLPTKFGERVVMRILEKSHSILKLSELGFAKGNLLVFRRLLSMPHGILLVTGPTGSGKSTTLYSALLTINSSERSILTLEDPIENEIRNIGQVQVKPEIGLTFAAGLRHILRQDPDVIMVGEIRDLETAEIAVQASLTGHLVFSTLHTNDSVSSITRLSDMGIDNYLIASTVIGLMAQRLIRVLCTKCRIPQPLTTQERERYGIDVEQVYSRGACSACRDTGYMGRVGIFELLAVTDEIREGIAAAVTTTRLRALAIDAGMTGLRQDGLDKVIQGISSLEEIDRVTGRHDA